MSRIYGLPQYYDEEQHLADGGGTVVSTTTTTSSNANTTISPLSSCPFSKSFPRFRIDLTTKQRRQQQRRLDQKQKLPFFSNHWILPLLFPSPLFKNTSMRRSKLEQLLKKKQNQKSRHEQNANVIVVQSDIDGVAAMTFLWQQAAILIGGIPDSTDILDQQAITMLLLPSTTTSRIVALPDASPELVTNFVEIIEWMATLKKDNVDGDDHKENDKHIVLRASIVQEEGLEFPVVRLQRVEQEIPTDKYNIPNDHNMDDMSMQEQTVNERTRKWVKRLLVEQGICPFTKSDRKSGQGLADLGVPVGSIAYHTSFQTNAIGLFADTWKAIHDMIQAGSSGKEGISSILLAAPAFDDDFDYWAGPIFTVLEASVVAAQAESQIGVVCFHPKYATPDGTSFPGFGHMHSVPRLEKWYNEFSKQTQDPSCGTISELTSEQIAAGGAWQRRTPHATINVLRADQLEVAESRRNSAKLYAENIEKLVGKNGIGNEKLAMDLEAEREFGNQQ